MKIKYRDMVGDLSPEVYSESCKCCHFYKGCVPYDVWACKNTIFKKSESEIFNL